MNKKVLIITSIVIFVLIAILLIIGITNKTYFKRYYEVTNPLGDEIKIPVPLFSYYNEVYGKYNVTFSTLKSTESTRNILNNYIENLKSCYDEGYFYDQDLDITISKYSVEDEFPFNKISLAYTYGNYCENEYVLDNNWANETIKKAEIKEVVIDKCFTENGVIKCNNKTINRTDVDELLNSVTLEGITRVENKNNFGIDPTKDYYSISVYYMLDSKDYTMNIFKYNNNLAFKVIDANDHQKNAIYNINRDVDQVLRDIYNKY